MYTLVSRVIAQQPGARLALRRRGSRAPAVQGSCTMIIQCLPAGCGGGGLASQSYFLDERWHSTFWPFCGCCIPTEISAYRKVGVVYYLSSYVKMLAAEPRN